MHLKAWIFSFFPVLFFGICLPAYSTLYAVILKTAGTDAQLPYMQARTLLTQNWYQLTLKPLEESSLPSSESLQQALNEELPKVSLTKQQAPNGSYFYTGTDSTNNNFYIGWLVQHPARYTADLTVVTTLYSQLLSSRPVIELNAPPPELTSYPTPIPEVTLLKASHPDNHETKEYSLTYLEIFNSCRYLLTPAIPEGTPVNQLLHRLETLRITPQFQPQTMSRTMKSRRHNQPSLIAAVPPPHSLQLDQHHEPRDDSHVLNGEANHLSTQELLSSGIPQRPDLIPWKTITTFRNGDFGKVQLLQSPHNRKLVIKRIKSDRENYKYLSRETSFLHQMSHKFIIQLQGIAVRTTRNGGKELWVALDYFPEGDMSDLLKNNPSLFTDQNIKAIIRGISSAIEYLHNRDIAHRDLKPDNILLASDKGTFTLIKLADFGLATYAGPGSCNSLPCGSPNYVAPEVLTTSPPYRTVKKSDIWGIGLILFVSYVKNTPYPRRLESPRALINWRTRYPEQEAGSPSSIGMFQGSSPSPPSEAGDMVTQCCALTPEHRPDAKTILIHPFLQEPVKAVRKVHPSTKM